MKNTYSQNGEDLVILNALERRGVTTGTLLDIGAWDWEIFSNSRLLLQQGWAGVLIEPSPGALRGRQEKPYGLIGAYAEREDVSVVCALAGLERGIKKISVTDDAVSGDDPEELAKWKKNNVGGFYGECFYPVITIQDIFDRFGGPFPFVNIDAEGSSVDLAIAYLKTEAIPAVMCVEHNRRFEDLMAAAQKRGYANIHTTPENIILEHTA